MFVGLHVVAHPLIRFEVIIAEDALVEMVIMTAGSTMLPQIIQTLEIHVAVLASEDGGNKMLADDSITA